MHRFYLADWGKSLVSKKKYLFQQGGYVLLADNDAFGAQNSRFRLNLTGKYIYVKNMVGKWVRVFLPMRIGNLIPGIRETMACLKDLH